MPNTETRPTMKNQTLRSIGCGIAAVFCLAMMAQAENPANGPAARDGLVVEYRFEGNASDTSGNGRHAELRGQPGFVEGRQGQCLALNGAGDYADSLLPLADLGDTFTVECWVKPDSQQNRYANIFGNHAHGGLGFVAQQDGAASNRFTMGYGMGAGQWVLTRPVRLTPGKWQHVAMVKTPETLSFFLNGVAVASVPATAPMAASPTTLRAGLGFSGQERCFRGCIDEFRVWKRALTKFELDLTPEEKAMHMVERLDLGWVSAHHSQP